MKQEKTKKIEYIFLLFTSVLVFCLYLNSIDGDLIFDDTSSIKENASIRMKTISSQSLSRAFSTNRPVANLSFALNFHFHEYKTFGFHLVNIFIHILAGILLYLFIKKTFLLLPGKNLPDHYIWITMAATLLWVVHPIQTQSVSYIVQRMTSMSSMFYILTMLCYIRLRIEIREAGSENPIKKWLYFSFILAAGFLAIGSKETAATLPVFLFLYEWFFFQNLNGKWFKKYFIKFCAILVPAAMAGAFFINDFYSDFFAKGYKIYDFNLMERLYSEFRVVIYYISLLIFPHPSRLMLDYDFAVSRSLIYPPSTIFCMLALFAMVIYACFLAKKHRIISFAIFWYFGNLVIESTVLPIELVYEHRNYLPSMLIFLIPLIAAFKYAKNWKAVVSMICVIAAVFSFWTFQRNHVWQSEVCLWQDAVNKSPEKARCHNNFGLALVKEGKADEGTAYFQKAVELDPKYFDPLFNLGLMNLNAKKFDKAVFYLKKAVQLKSKDFKALMCLGMAYLDNDNAEKAVVCFKQADELGADDVSEFRYLAMRLFKTGNPDKAFNLLQKAMKMEPDDAKLHNLLGTHLMEFGRVAEAIDHFKTSVKLDSNYIYPCMNLGKCFSYKKDFKKALASFKDALDINKKFISGYNEAGITALRLGETDEAEKYLQDALKIDPANKTAKNHLGLLKKLSGIDDAIADLQKNVINTEKIMMRYQLGKLYTEKMAHGKAEKIYRSILSLKPGDFTALNNIALLNVLNKNYQKTIDIYSEMAELFPEKSGIFYNMACIYSKMNLVEKSAEAIKHAVDAGYNNMDKIKNDPDLINLRASSEFKKMELL